MLDSENKLIVRRPPPQSVEVKIKLLKDALPNLDTDELAPEISSFHKGQSEDFRIHFREGSWIDYNSARKSVHRFGLGKTARNWAEKIAKSLSATLATDPVDEWGRSKNVGSADRLAPLTREECDHLIVAWARRGFDRASASPEGVWVEVDEKSFVLDRGNEAMLRGSITDAAIIALLMKASEEWGGRIELIGNDQFKLRAWELAQKAGVVVIGFDPPNAPVFGGMMPISSIPASEDDKPNSKRNEERKSTNTVSRSETSEPCNTASSTANLKSSNISNFSSIIEASKDDSYDIEPFNDDSPSI